MTRTDWAELQALLSPDGNVSAEDLAGELRQLGDGEEAAIEAYEQSHDTTDEDSIPFNLDGDGSFSYSLAEDAFMEAELRLQACGKHYPFDVANNYIQAKDDARGSLYAFLLLLRWYGESALGNEDRVSVLFEEISMAAARGYFGWDTTESYRFGYPRPTDQPEGFRDALIELASRLREGFTPHTANPLASQKDGGLDVVVWKGFPDASPSKLIGFGQCATGKDWVDKTQDFSFSYFFQQWATPPPPVGVGMMFVPFCIDPDRWLQHANHAGVLFDRCRIASLADVMPEDVRTAWRSWVTELVREATAI